MAKKLTFLSLILLLISLHGSYSQVQPYIIFDKTRNVVIGHSTMNYKPVFNYNAGAGLRFFIKDQYTIGGEISFLETGLYEKKVFSSGTMAERIYINRVLFRKINMPVLLQVHHPLWYYGFGGGISRLYSSSQIETDSYAFKDAQTITLDKHIFPTTELFVQFSAGLKLMSWLELNFQFHQAFSDIGYDYSWKKNQFSGLGLRMFFNKPPVIEKRNYYAGKPPGRGGSKFAIHKSNNIVRNNIRKVGDHPSKITFRLTPIGSGSFGSNRIISVDLESTNGDPNVGGRNPEILNVTFPVIATIRFVANDVYHKSTFEGIFQFEIFEPGHWEIFLQY
jgi:hypothetical protein